MIYKERRTNQDFVFLLLWKTDNSGTWVCKENTQKYLKMKLILQRTEEKNITKDTKWRHYGTSR
ncbi:MAG TPA: hypothetical protein PLL89_02555 [bacterium]|nr:hypothetical protein [bacterium]